jgi:hypothetical protein
MADPDRFATATETGNGGHAFPPRTTFFDFFAKSRSKSASWTVVRLTAPTSVSSRRQFNHEKGQT